MANVMFAWGNKVPTTTQEGGIYLNKSAARMYIQTDSDLLQFDGKILTSATPSTTLANNTWDTISYYSQKGTASTYWSVGDTKDVTLSTGEVITLVILGFDHDEGAGITFGMKDCLNTTYPMNSTNTNVGGWTSSVMRTSTMQTLYDLLPSELKSVIVPVPKLTSAGNKSTTIETTYDKLFLLSEVEVWGNTNYSVSGEGTQYAYFANNGVTGDYSDFVIKNVNGSAGNWWLRSPSSGLATSFCAVSGGGRASNGSASFSRGVSFGFGV